MSDMVISLADLRRACALLLDAAEKHHGEHVELESIAADHYWDLPFAGAFDMSSDPATDIGVGQVSDDLDEIHALLARSPDEPVILWHDLIHLCGLLRAIALADAAR
ncbi:hypothetical protein OG884_16665 [Streptosporangium sp. NBC_01755]|uniref:hypothetical protein n=1 Tax=unclassified Streptosporangium TaxID=2632669 RepID=UPI002DD9673A|nr:MULTISPECIES: hypothetical protein [unclassified Streptosporangium]WSA25207.1 hypothetical protein OIE13_30450 [Streptosporangium sp. NBC_01810]WSD03453.1 hypothetical protein OG884_16665 [Streptosporangium sp. NBC_01755]